MSWFLVEEPWPTAHPTGMVRTPIEAATRADVPKNFIVLSGPYATKADAMAQQVKQPNGSTVTNDSQPPQSQAGLPPIPNPLSGINAIGDFFSRLTEPQTWIRIAKVLAGGTLLIVGLSHITGADNKVAEAARNIKVLPV